MADPYEGDSAVQNIPGILGRNSAGGAGVDGESDGGRGVAGFSKTSQGVYGKSDANAGVVGEGNAKGGWGVYGTSDSGCGVSGLSKTWQGVYGRSDANAGVVGEGNAKGGWGVYGTSDNGCGVAGLSKTWQGVYGKSDTNAGVVGESKGFDGVWGVCHSKDHAAVSGHNDAGGWAGYFEGGVHVTRDLTVDGDVILANADIAEDFDVADVNLEAGMVLCVSEDEQLRPCSDEYDSRVVGVVSGARELHPGIILGRLRDGSSLRVTIALMGRVYCMVDATTAPIRPGDQLTTSRTVGHAMRADPAHAAGTVLGKALRSLAGERGLIPILVTLQ
jgi:hypothetical protein